MPEPSLSSAVDEVDVEAGGADAAESSGGVGEVVGCSKEVGLKRRRIAVVARGEVVVEPPSLYFVVGTEEQC